MAHDHPHSGIAHGDRTRSLGWTLALVIAYTVAEVIGGIWSGSLALLADAGHMVSDAAALALTLFAIRFARKAPTAERTFGFHRAEILAALVNGVTLIAIALFIFMEAYERLQQPHQVEGGLMLGVAAGGLAVNLAGLWLLGGSHAHDLNVRGAWLHVFTDALGSVQAIAAGALDPAVRLVLGRSARVDPHRAARRVLSRGHSSVSPSMCSWKAHRLTFRSLMCGLR